MNNLQYRSLIVSIGFGEQSAWLSNRARYRHLRPAHPVRNRARAWWQFMCDATLVDFRRRTKLWSWSNFIAPRRRQRRRYQELFAKQLDSGKIRTPNEQQEVTKIEFEFPAEDIVQCTPLTRARLPPMTHP